MCVSEPVQLNINKIIAFKIMQQSGKNEFTPIFKDASLNDSRKFKKGILYSAKSTKHGFSGNTSLINTKAVLRTIKSSYYWSTKYSLKEEKLVIVLVELRENLQYSGTNCFREDDGYNFGNSHVQGREMKILGKIPKYMLT